MIKNEEKIINRFCVNFKKKACTIYAKINVFDIVKIKIINLKKIFRNEDIKLSYNNNVLNFLIENGYNNEYGKKPLKRPIQKEILYNITDFLLKK